jgi:hypothetical protein
MGVIWIAAVKATDRRVTCAEMLAWPDSRRRYELDGGEVEPAPPGSLIAA